MDVKKISKICRPVRLVVGGGLIGYGIYSGNPLFYLGVSSSYWLGVVNFLVQLLVELQRQVVLIIWEKRISLKTLILLSSQFFLNPVG